MCVRGYHIVTTAVSKGGVSGDAITYGADVPEIYGRSGGRATAAGGPAEGGQTEEHLEKVGFTWVGWAWGGHSGVCVCGGGQDASHPAGHAASHSA